MVAWAVLIVGCVDSAARVKLRCCALLMVWCCGVVVVDGVNLGWQARCRSCRDCLDSPLVSQTLVSCAPGLSFGVYKWLTPSK